VADVLRGAVARAESARLSPDRPAASGKTTAARIIAMALNCPNGTPRGDPAGSARNCLGSGTAQANSTLSISMRQQPGVDDARDLARAGMYAASREAQYKVTSSDEAQMLTREAWNSAAKVLEEPPPGVVFVLATTDRRRLPAAAAPVLSRLQRSTQAASDRSHPGPAAAGLEASGSRRTTTRERSRPARRRACATRSACLDQCLRFGKAPYRERVARCWAHRGEEITKKSLTSSRNPAAEGVFRWSTGW